MFEYGDAVQVALITAECFANAPAVRELMGRLGGPLSLVVSLRRRRV